ncbi:MAG: hypothetical protein WBA74_24095 [Cyclobacteriaceae bacterium]
MKKTVLLASIFILFFHISFAQRFKNPSFYGPRSSSTTPAGWNICDRNSSPDIQPGSWNVSLSPSHGSSYISLVTRGDYGGSDRDFTTEDIQTELINPFWINVAYKFHIDLATSDSFNDHTGPNGIRRFDIPTKLEIYGADINCGIQELLWESPPITHNDWKTYTVTIAPKTIVVKYLYLKAQYGTTTRGFGNILIDNIRNCELDLAWQDELSICDDQPYILDASVPAGQYRWQDGSTGPTFEITEPGRYSVEVFNGCESKTYEVDVTSRNCFCDTAVPIQTVAYDSLICENEPFIIDAYTPGGIYKWNTGSEEAKITVTEAGLYTVEVSNRCNTETFNPEYSIGNLFRS